MTEEMTGAARATTSIWIALGMATPSTSTSRLHTPVAPAGTTSAHCSAVSWTLVVTHAGAGVAGAPGAGVNWTANIERSAPNRSPTMVTTSPLAHEIGFPGMHPVTPVAIGRALASVTSRATSESAPSVSTWTV